MLTGNWLDSKDWLKTKIIGREKCVLIGDNDEHTSAINANKNSQNSAQTKLGS